MNFLKRVREPVNGYTHLVAALAGVIGIILLLILSKDDAPKQISLAVYGTSLVLLFTASAAYHLVIAKPAAIENLRKFDHSAIYLLIAGTYTPICFNMFGGFWKWGMLAIIWSLALVGISIKLFIIRSPRWLNTAIYLAMGWLVVVAVGELVRALPVGAIVLLALGGVVYSIGAVVYATKSLNFIPGVFGFHEVWHIFVILGALFHFLTIAIFIAPA